MARILIADDSAPSVSFVTNILRGDGHRVVALRAQADLAQSIRRRIPALILLEPGRHGDAEADLLRQARELDIPILIYSSRPPEELKEMAERLHAVDALSKDGPAHQLLQAVNRALIRQLFVREFEPVIPVRAS